MISVKDRDKLIRYLKRNKIETKIHYPVPLNKQKAAKNLNLNQNDFKVANMQFKTITYATYSSIYDKKTVDLYLSKYKNFIINSYDFKRLKKFMTTK